MKKLRILLLLTVVAIVLAGCKKKKQEPETEMPTEAVTEPETETESETETEPETEETDTGIYSYLTGLPVEKEIKEHRPIAVMFNNIEVAVPQAGIANAEVIYEAPVEGGLTRLMGILEDYKDLEKIGSVRSCRNYYVYYAREFDAVYCHYGQAVYALPLLDNDDTHNLSGLDGYGAQVYYRTSDRVAPHNAYTSGEGIDKGIEIREFRSDYDKDYDGHYQFAKKNDPTVLSNGVDAVKVTPGYTVNKPWFEYDEKDKLYYRFQYGGEQIDETTGEQLTYTNIIFQYSKWENFDENGYLNIDTTSGGEGMFITGGKAVDITWKKDSEWGVTRYYDKSGEEIKLNQGKTWVCIIQDSYTNRIELSGK